MIPELKSIVVGVAEFGVPDPALNVALQIARQAGARLHAVHACPAPPGLTRSSRARFDREWVRGEGHRLQELVRAQITRSGGWKDATAGAAPGTPVEVIHEAAVSRGADLIVVGATRHGPLSRAVLGTTAHRVLSGASAPVLLARRSAHPVRRALLATDLSALSGRTIARALRLLPLMLGETPLLRSLLVTGSDSDLAAMVPGLVDLAGIELDQFLAEAAPGQLDDRRVRVGLPGPEIIAEAEQWEADLVVLGTHSRRGLRRALMGSVAEWVLQRSRCNVLVFPACADHREGPIATPRLMEATA